MPGLGSAGEEELGVEEARTCGRSERGARGGSGAPPVQNPRGRRVEWEARRRDERQSEDVHAERTEATCVALPDARAVAALTVCDEGEAPWRTSEGTGVTRV